MQKHYSFIHQVFAKIFLLLFVVLAQQSLAQNNTGKEFWLTPTGGRFYIDQSTKIMVVGNYDATITINFEALPHPTSPLDVNYCTQQTVTHVGGQVTVITIPFDNLVNCARYVDDLQLPETVQKNGCHITSTAPIAIYYTHYEFASGEATPIHPIEKLGMEYYISAFRENSTDTYWAAVSTVVATENNTSVTFKMSSETYTSAGDGADLGDTVTLHKPNTQWTVVLNKGETYSICSNRATLVSNGNANPWGSTVPDKWNTGLNGVKVTSDKRIAVFGGSPITRIGDYEYAGCSAGDITFTHLLPTNHWGTSFVGTQTLLRTYNIVTLKTPAPPHFENYPPTSADKSLSDYLLVTAKDNGTVVNIGGRSNYTKTINAGEFFIYESPGKSAAIALNPGQLQNTVTSNNPIQVVQLMKGGYCDGAAATNGGDPDQMWVFKEDSWVDNYLITNPVDYTSNYIVLLVKEPLGGNQARTSLSLIAGGTPIAIPAGNSASPLNDGTGGWSRMGTTPYYFQRIPLSVSGVPIRVRSVPATPTSPTYPFAFYLSGGLGAGSYGYMGGASCTMDVFAHANPINLCTTNQVPLIMDSTINGGAIGGVVTYNYTWTVFNGATQVATNSGVGTNPSYTFVPTTAGTYLGILQITDNAGCTARDSFNIVVSNSPPIASISYSSATYCTSAVNPTPIITGTTGGVFSSTAGLVINATTGVINLSGSTPGSYTVTYTYGIAPCTAVATFAVSVVANPTVTVNDPAICAGSSATLTAVPSPTGGTFMWTPGNQTTNPITVSPSSTSNYTVTYTLSGCTASDIATVTVNPIPTVSSTSVTICNGASGTITATGTPSGGTYLWTPTGVTTASLTQSPSSTTTYSVNYTSNGCSVTANGTMTVQPLPTATISGGGAICTGQTAPISIALTGSGPWSITYSDGSMTNTVNGITSSPYTFNTGTAGTYTVTNVSTNGCAGTSSGSAIVNVSTNVIVSNQQVNCNPGNADYTVTFEITGGNAPYTVTGGTGTVSASAPYIFTSNPVPSGASYSYNVSDGAACNVVNVSGFQDCNCPATAVISGGGAVCQGQSATININFTGTAPFNFSYTDGTTTSAVLTTSLTTYSFTANTNGNYSLVSFNDATCLGARSGNAIVTIKPEPTSTTNSSTICAGQTASVTCTPGIAGGSYLWTAPASVAGQSTQSVTVSPGATTKYYVTYTLNGCAHLDSGTVTVNPVPTMSIANQTICEGTTATIVASGSPAGGTYSWTSPASVAGQTNATITDNPTTTTTYTATYLLNGCSVNASGVVTVSPSPVISVSPTAQSICPGNSVVLTATSTATGGTYNWSPGPLPTTASISVSPSTTTTYSVTHTISGCTSNSVSSTITVNPAVVATASSNSPLCEGDNLNLSVNATAGATYSWTGPNGFTSTVNNPTINSVNQTHSGNYLVTVTANGCSATSTASVSISATPVISVGASTSTICPGESTTLTVNSSVSGGTFNWSPGPLPTTQSISVSPAATTTYSVTHTVGTCVSNSATVTITVNTPPTAIPTSNSPVCAGSSLNLSANTIAGGTYLWSGPGFTSSTQNPSINPVQTSNAGSYTLTITANNCPSAPVSINVTVDPVPNTTISPAGPFCVDANPVTLSAVSPGGTWSGNGITNPSTGAFNPSIANPGTHTITYSIGGNCPSSSTRSIVVNDVPSIQLSGSPLSGCDPLNVAFNSTISPTPSSVQWTFGDGGSSTNSGPVSHTYTNTGIYTVSLQATANGCSSTLVQSNYISVYATPTASFVAQSQGGSTVSFTNNSALADSYLWDFGNGQTSTETNPTFNFGSGSSEPTVQLIAITNNGCRDTVRIRVTIEEEVVFYVPNAFTPDDDALNRYFGPVMTSGYEPKSYNMVIYNRWGAKIFESNDPNIGWDGTFNNQLSPNGAYTWVLKFTDKNTDRKYQYEGTLNLLR